jgi:serine/threonine protein kinase HipA of HipAB toxin-antitoxin module
MGTTGRYGRRSVMQLGIFARTFPRPTLEEVFDARFQAKAVLRISSETTGSAFELEASMLFPILVQ